MEVMLEWQSFAHFAYLLSIGRPHQIPAIGCRHRLSSAYGANSLKSSAEVLILKNAEPGNLMPGASDEERSV